MRQRQRLFRTKSDKNESAFHVKTRAASVAYVVLRAECR
ncbi:hypothetical protein BURMUCGD1_3801 [Burkholderia multivorans CGD1]|nr:hypothetical protein BURMUCGD1_3801 [Burkholderia multivorans CGD1]